MRNRRCSARDDQDDGEAETTAGPILDAHSDLLNELVDPRAVDDQFSEYWLPALRGGGVRLQVCAIYVRLEDHPELALRRALEQAVACRRAVRDHRDDVLLVSSQEDLDRVESGSKLGLLLAMEGCEPLGTDPDFSELFWDLGARVFALTWNRRNAFADGAAEESDGGLSELGRRLVTKLIRLGALIDLAHSSERTFFQVVDLLEDRPAVVSHSGCRALYDTPRNVSDEQMQRLAARGGVLGIQAHPAALGPGAGLASVVDHLDHAVQVVGIDHVGMGADFVKRFADLGLIASPSAALLPSGGAMLEAVEGFAGPEDFPALCAVLAARGYSSDHVHAILWSNFARILRATLPRVG